MVRDNGWSANYTSILTGTEESLFEKGWAIYPNPAIDHIVVENSMMVRDAVCEVYSTQGCLLIRQCIYSDKTELDVESFSSGVYFIKIEDGNGYFIEKFVKK